MDLIGHLQLGLSVAFTLQNILYCFLGVLLGTLVGVLPGIGPVATIAMLLPFTFGVPPETALIMLAGIYYGAQYGGSTTAILMSLPGESSSAVTALDGHEMAKQGKAGPALAIAAIGSFVGGTVGTLCVALFAIPLTGIALKFQSADYFSLIVFGLVASIALAHGSVLKALAMVLLGLLCGLVGTDIYSGMQRFTFGYYDVADGLDFVALSVGLFGISEILRNLEAPETPRAISKIGSLWPDGATVRKCIAPVLRGTALGSFLGVLPGAGATISSFSAYAIEKKVSRSPEKFGKGAVEGVAAPETANNAAAQTSFIPMLTLGIPPTPVMALMIGAMLIQGINPGPAIISSQPNLFWGLVVSMWLGNVMLLALNLPLIGLWVRLLSIPYGIFYPAILVFCCVGVFATDLNFFDILTLSGFGLLGYVMIKCDCEPAPLLLGTVLGPLLEEYFRRAMIVSKGDLSVFITRPISATLLLLAAVVLALILFPLVRRQRETVFVE
ncbi:MAG: tripartite tricarboxylate transporter permease [Rhizobiaceae bacterium]|nr:tripartite tricarboxylate transporter permease [Rhizobiaceae bacterium]